MIEKFDSKKVTFCLIRERQILQDYEADTLGGSSNRSTG